MTRWVHKNLPRALLRQRMRRALRRPRGSLLWTTGTTRSAELGITQMDQSYAALWPNFTPPLTHRARAKPTPPVEDQVRVQAMPARNRGNRNPRLSRLRNNLPLERLRIVPPPTRTPIRHRLKCPSKRKRTSIARTQTLADNHQTDKAALTGRLRYGRRR